MKGSDLANEFSFIHLGDENMASYRYRCLMPSKELNIPINQEANIYILSKPQESDLDKELFIADFCDDHFDKFDWYKKILKKAILVTCTTEYMKQRIKALGRDAIVIPDAYEYPLEHSHCNGDALLWYGHGSNIYSILKLLPELDYVKIVSNVQGSIPWSHDTMLNEFKKADFVLMPATKEYKSPNRTIEAIRQGCFVVAEPHPSIMDFPIYIGDIKEGIEWAKTHRKQANEMITKAQMYVERYSPKILASAWKQTLGFASILAAAKPNGAAG